MSILLLCGPKHVGKTSVAYILSALCNWEVIDLDELVTSQTGKSPRVLYQEGLALFRKAEYKALASSLVGQRSALCIVAAGGGLIDNEAAIRLVDSDNVIVVYFAVSADTAWERIRAEKSLPPFLNTETPEATHRALHERRAAAYHDLVQRKHGWVIQAEDKSSYTIAKEIASIMKSINHE
ncbi:MAG: shikimate kinase [Treponema sp.]|jgi:shikimate kinase|nr:shikimate kinase [Treponema sp.]